MIVCVCNNINAAQIQQQKPCSSLGKFFKKVGKVPQCGACCAEILKNLKTE